MPDSSVGAVYPNHARSQHHHAFWGVGCWISHPTTQMSALPVHRSIRWRLTFASNNLISRGNQPATFRFQLSMTQITTFKRFGKTHAPGGWVQTTVMKPGQAYYVTTSPGRNYLDRLFRSAFGNDHLGFSVVKILSRNPGLVISDALGMKQRLHFSVDFWTIMTICPNPETYGHVAIQVVRYLSLEYGATSGTNNDRHSGWQHIR